MPKATPSKAALPKKPTKPRLVQDEGLNAQRDAEYKRALAQWEVDKAAYEEGQKQRDRQKRKARAQGETEEGGDQGGERGPPARRGKDKETQPTETARQYFARYDLAGDVYIDSDEEDDERADVWIRASRGILVGCRAPFFV